MTIRQSNIWEYYLFLKRKQQIEKLLPEKFDSILDFGYGEIPLFLIEIEAERKIGYNNSDFICVKNRIYQRTMTPEEYSFDVITAMAILEHLDSSKTLIEFALKYLKPGGILVGTTPTPFIHPLLKVLSNLKILSPIEIKEHKHYYNQRQLGNLLTIFRFKNIKTGFFELGLNQWFYGVKGEK